MVGSRTLTAAVGIAGSLVISALLWYVFGTAVFFLFVPVIPFLFRGLDRRDGGEKRQVSTRTCPRCGFQTGEATFEYCPRDGSHLD